MTQKITQMRLVRYLFTTVLALLFVNCSKGRSSDEPKPYTQGEHTPSSKQAEDKISPDDYLLSADGRSLIEWKNKITQNLDMNRDSRLRKITFIEKSAFYYCSSLASVTIPNSVTTIGSQAFSGCRSLTNVNIPNSVTTIGVGAFSNCSSLTKVNIPSSVTTIGKEAFSNCGNLTNVNIPSSVTTIGESTFQTVEV